MTEVQSMPMKVKTYLKQRMLEKSVKLGYQLTQAELSKETGLSLPTISRWYSGNFDRVDLNSLYALMKYFECDMSQLFEVVDE